MRMSLPLESTLSSDSDDADHTHIVIDTVTTCHRCRKTFPTQAARRRHSKTCALQGASKKEIIKTPSPCEPAQRTCVNCLEILPSRNQLFKHIEHCKKPMLDKELRLRAPEPEPEDPEVKKGYQQMVVKEAPPLGLNDGAVQSSYTFLKIQARPSPEGEDVGVCIDQAQDGPSLAEITSIPWSTPSNHGLAESRVYTKRCSG